MNGPIVRFYGPTLDAIASAKALISAAIADKVKPNNSQGGRPPRKTEGGDVDGQELYVLYMCDCIDVDL